MQAIVFNGLFNFVYFVFTMSELLSIAIQYNLVLM